MVLAPTVGFKDALVQDSAQCFVPFREQISIISKDNSSSNYLKRLANEQVGLDRESSDKKQRRCDVVVTELCNEASHGPVSFATPRQTGQLFVRAKPARVDKALSDRLIRFQKREGRLQYRSNLRKRNELGHTLRH